MLVQKYGTENVKFGQNGAGNVVSIIVDNLKISAIYAGFPLCCGTNALYRFNIYLVEEGKIDMYLNNKESFNEEQIKTIQEVYLDIARYSMEARRNGSVVALHNEEHDWMFGEEWDKCHSYINPIHDSTVNYYILSPQQVKP